MLAIARNILILFSAGLIFLLAGCEPTKDTGNSESSSNVSTASNNDSTLLTQMIEKRQDFELVVLSDGRLLSIGGRGVASDTYMSAVDTTEVYETYIQGLINDIENVILDEKLVTKLLGNALKKAPKRTEKFMR